MWVRKNRVAVMIATMAVCTALNTYTNMLRLRTRRQAVRYNSRLSHNNARLSEFVACKRGGDELRSDDRPVITTCEA